MTHVDPNLVQDSFRGRNDDGSESAATWKDAANTNWSQGLDENFRVRFLVRETAGGGVNNVNLQLEYNLGGAGWNAVNATSAVARSSASTHFADDDNTTQQIGSGTFITPNSGMDEDNGLAGETQDIDFVGNDEVEVEYCLQLRSADVANNDTIQFRVTSAGTPLEGYTNTPTVTAVGAITGTGSVTAGAPGTTASGTITKTGTANVTAGAPGTSASGEIVKTGSASVTPGQPTATGSGTVGVIFPDDWGRKAEIIIQSSQVNSNLTDFPVLLTEATLPSEMFDSDGANPAQSDGADIRFTSDAAGTTELAFEIVEFVTDPNPANGTAQIWVKVPSVSSSANTSIYVWYDQPIASAYGDADTFGRNNVWTAYRSVHHLEDAGTSHTDSTGNGNTGTSTNSGLNTAAQVGDGAYVNATAGNAIDTGDTEISGYTEFSVSAWFQLDSGASTANSHRIVSKDQVGTSGAVVFWFWDSTGEWGIWLRDGSQWRQANVAESSVSLFDNSPHHIAGRWDGSNVYLTIDGVDQAGPTAFTNSINDSENEEFVIGADSDVAAHDLMFDGWIDEVHISPNAFSEDWFNAEYNNQNSPSTFAIDQTPQDAGGVSGTANVTAGAPTVSATGEITKTGSASVTPTAPTTSATGEIVKTGSASVTPAAPSTTASGAVEKTGTASVTPDQPTATGTGSVEGTITGAGDVTAGAPSASATGEIVKTGSAAVTPASPSTSAAGEIVKTGTASVTPGAPTATATGTVSGAVTGTADVTAGTPTASATGEITKTGSASVSPDAPSTAATGEIVKTGTASVTAGSPSATAAGTVTAGEITGAGSVTAGQPTASGIGEVKVTGTATVVPTSPTVEAAGIIARVGVGNVIAGQPTVEAAGALFVGANPSRTFAVSSHDGNRASGVANRNRTATVKKR